MMRGYFRHRTSRERAARSEGHDCANGAAGLSALARGGHSLLLVDGDSLAGDGRALLDAARDAGPVPLIVITESGASADLGPWWRVGALRVISKPFSVATLNRCVRELLCDARAGDPGAGP